MSKVIVDTLENTAGTFTSAIDSLGPSTDYAAVGTHLFARSTGSYTLNQGVLFSAATRNLYPSNNSGNYLGSSGSEITFGTWRCMGSKPSTLDNGNSATLFVRVS